MIQSHGYAAHAVGGPLQPYAFERRDPRPHDVLIEILYCGVCHSDLHVVRNEWGNASFPVVPGHEIVGRVTARGAEASRFKEGDLVGVGCMVDSCRHCRSCQRGDEQYCPELVWTYNSPERGTGAMTMGGYSNAIVVDQAYVVAIPDGLDLAGVAPLLCAGVTTWSPLKHWKVGPGSEVGVIGLGGLGHMALKLAAAMGAKVTLFTTSPGKREDALRLGAHAVVVSTDAEAMAACAGTFDLIIDTISVPHDLAATASLLAHDGALVLVGLPAEPHPPLNAFPLVFGRRSIAGSLIGSIRETEEMLAFCARHQIVSDIELISIAEINQAYDRLLAGDVKYRFVIDMASLAPTAG